MLMPLRSSPSTSSSSSSSSSLLTATTSIIIWLRSFVRFSLSHSPFLTRGNAAVNGVGSSQYSNSYIIIIATIITVIIVMAVMVMAVVLVVVMFVAGRNGFACERDSQCVKIFPCVMCQL